MTRLFSLPLVLLGMSLLVALIARLVLLPIGLWLRRQQGFSDEFVTELSVAAPLALLIVSYAAWFTWVSQ